MRLGDRTSVLDGGLAAWRADDRPLTKESPVIARGTLTAQPPRPDTIVDAAWVASHLHDPKVAVIDARTRPFQASQVYFAARLLGYRVHLHDGSFEEGSPRPDLPIEAASVIKKP